MTIRKSKGFRPPVRKKKAKKVVRTSVVARKKKTKATPKKTRQAIIQAMASVLESHGWSVYLDTSKECTRCDTDDYDSCQKFCGECGSALEVRFDGIDGDETVKELWEAYQAAKKLDK